MEYASNQQEGNLEQDSEPEVAVREGAILYSLRAIEFVLGVHRDETSMQDRG